MAQWPGWRDCSPITESVNMPKGPMETDNRMGEYSRASCEKERGPSSSILPSLFPFKKTRDQPLASPPKHLCPVPWGPWERCRFFHQCRLVLLGRPEWMHAQEWLAEPSARAGRPYRGAECRSPFHMEMDDAECSQLLYNWLWLARPKRSHGEKTYWYAKAAWHWRRVERRQT